MSIKQLPLHSKHMIIYRIERNLNTHLYPEMFQALSEVINKNTFTTLGLHDDKMPLMCKGVVYDPVLVKPLQHLSRTTLPLHKTVAGEFAQFLSTYRKDLNAFALFRNMLIKAVAIADQEYDICVLTTIPESLVLSDTASKSTSRLITDEVINEFKTNHAKSIDLVQYYSTFTQLFGDIDLDTEE